MSHGKLLWFAAGAATSAVVSISAGLIWSRPAPTVAFLVLEEPSGETPPPGEPIEEDYYAGIIASQTGEMLRDCEAKSFETTVDTTLRATADLPLTPENSAAFACVLEESAKRGVRLNIELRTD